MKQFHSTQELLELIDIQAPYFALKNVSSTGNLLTAEIPVEQPLGHEAGPISAAEASRHLAILGVCSCALLNPVKKRHYYLAYRGIYERVDASVENSGSKGPLTAHATCISVDRKKAEAITELRDAAGNTIIHLRVFYHVILDTTFERLYKNNYSADPDFEIDNPYALEHPLFELKHSFDSMSCSMGIIPEFMCAGHFPHFPALPVAILVYNLFDLTNKLNINLANDNVKTIIKHYEIHADNLAFAGDKVDLEAKLISEQESGSREFLAEGFANGDKSVGKIHLVIETKDEPVSVPRYLKNDKKKQPL